MKIVILNHSCSLIECVNDMAPLECNDVEALLDGAKVSLSNSSWENIQNDANLLRYLTICREVASFVDDDGVVIDLGCGPGIATFFLGELGVRCVGVELQQHDTFTSMDRNFVIYDGNNLPFREQSIDAVLLIGVLEHVGVSRDHSRQDERQRLLKSVVRVLKKGGYLFVYYFPNKYSLNEFASWILGIGGRHRGDEKQTVKSVTSLVESSGVEIVSKKRTGLLPVDIGFILPKLRPFANRHAHWIDRSDYFLCKTPLNFFAQSISVVGRKRDS